MSEVVMGTTAALCKESKITTLMVTHDFEHAALYGDRLIIMREGTLAEEICDEEKRLLNARDIFDLFMRHQKPWSFEKERTFTNSNWGT
jgi:putative ABC transport system ATP-binding protein